MPKKTFAIDVLNQTVTPSLHRISKMQGDQIEWTVNDGSALVVFDPAVGTPVNFLEGPNFTYVRAAIGSGKLEGTHPHAVSCWYGEGANRHNISITAVLIVDP
jgi:hypothetical protein